jgi:serine/threonine protein kinase
MDKPEYRELTPDLAAELELGLENSSDFDLDSFRRRHSKYADAIDQHVRDYRYFEDIITPGSYVGSYKIERVLDSGGMGIVYVAKQETPNRTVALKMISHEDRSDQKLKLFEQEVKSVGTLDHAGIIPIFMGGVHKSQPYYVMPFVVGETLHKFVCRNGPVSPRIAARILQLLSEAVGYSHRRGIIHRDIKPRNVMVTQEALERLNNGILGSPAPPKPGDIRLFDFGLSALKDEQEAATAGTLAFMAPEQRTGKVSEKLDVFSLGATLFFLLTQKVPSFIVRKEKHVLEWSGQRAPTDLIAICKKCLATDPDARYVSVDELKEDLDLYLAQKPVSARRVTYAERSFYWAKRNQVLAAAIGCLVVSTAVFISFLLWQNQQLARAVELGESFFHGLESGRYSSTDDLIADTISGRLGSSDERREAAKLTMLALTNLRELAQHRASAEGKNILQNTLDLSKLLLAKHRLNLAIESDPRYGPAYLLRGLMRQSISDGDVRDAYLDFEMAIATMEASSVAYSGRGWCNWELGQYGSAQRDFETALKFDPKNQFAHIGLGRHFAEEGEKQDISRSAFHYEAAAINHDRYDIWDGWLSRFSSEISVGLWEASMEAFSQKDMNAAFTFASKAFPYTKQESRVGLLENLLIIACNLDDERRSDHIEEVQRLIAIADLREHELALRCILAVLQEPFDVSQISNFLESFCAVSDKFSGRFKHWFKANFPD